MDLKVGYIYRVSKKAEPYIKYAKYQDSVNIDRLNVYGLVLYMAFCHILTKFCVKIFTSFKNIVNFKNAVEIAFQRDNDFPV